MWPVAAVRVAKRAKGERRSECLEGWKAWPKEQEGRSRSAQRSNGARRSSARSSNEARRSSAQSSTSPSRSPARRDALGRRAAAGVPDSQSASERGERAEGPKSPREQGWRHLVVKSQVSDKAARRANARAASRERHFRMPFLPHRAKRGSGFPAGNPRLWKSFP